MLEQTILSQALEIQEELRSYRRWLHAHAEVGFDLKQTLSYVKEALEQMGYTPELCGRCGLTATVGKPGGAVVLLRADMDALPIREDTNLPFASSHGTMHACGHDMHTAMLLGAAKLLKRHEQALSGMVKLMFQPAEELFEGSSDMIQAGVLENPRPDAAFMSHVTAGSSIPAGTILVNRPGASAPAADYFTITVHGKGCHGSAPQDGVDALSVAAHILLALQQISARELAPSEEAALTIGTMHGGTAGNVIADSATMEGTIRTYQESTRSFIKNRMEQIVRGIAESFRASATLDFGSGCPALWNDGKLCELSTNWLKTLLGPTKALSLEELGPQTKGGGSEDFAYISQQVPALMLVLAAGEPEKGYIYPQHHPKVKFDESVLNTGSAAFAYLALQYLAHHPNQL